MLGAPEASERLSGESSKPDGRTAEWWAAAWIRILNPAGRRMLHLQEAGISRDYRVSAARVGPVGA